MFKLPKRKTYGTHTFSTLFIRFVFVQERAFSDFFVSFASIYQMLAYVG